MSRSKVRMQAMLPLSGSIASWQAVQRAKASHPKSDLASNLSAILGATAVAAAQHPLC